jgi:hypothetical protein
VWSVRRQLKDIGSYGMQRGCPSHS